MVQLYVSPMEPHVDGSIAIRRCRTAANRPRSLRCAGICAAFALALSPWSLGAPGSEVGTQNQAWAQTVPSQGSTWMIREGEQRLALRAPQGFMRQNTDGAGLAAFAHPGRRAVMLVFELPEPMEQGRALDDAQWQQLRQGDTFESTDTRGTFRVLGFDAPALVGRGEIEGTRVVRFVATVPLQGSTPAVFLLGPERDEAALRQSLIATLASVRGDTHWTTRAQRVLNRASAWGFILAVLSAVVYAIGLRFRWKKLDEAPPTIARVAIRATLGASLVATSLWWLREPSWMGRGMGLLLALFGAQQAYASVALFRARAQRPREPSASEEREPSASEDSEASGSEAREPEKRVEGEERAEP